MTLYAPAAAQMRKAVEVFVLVYDSCLWANLNFNWSLDNSSITDTDPFRVSICVLKICANNKFSVILFQNFCNSWKDIHACKDRGITRKRGFEIALFFLHEGRVQSLSQAKSRTVLQLHFSLLWKTKIYIVRYKNLQNCHRKHLHGNCQNGR